MTEYQVISKRFRPQKFHEVIGQDAIVLTLKNAIKYQRLAHAYLFCGSRGTGKTTLARVFAKALNCKNLSSDFEPCNECHSCKEISTGSSLDVLEIDGASNRGIDKIRQINETVAYSSSSGGYKIYIIDEVHMLTTEAFNALLKTLEEPPSKVKFFFATTEPHKVLPTILSRCQRFNLTRISLEKIIDKLKKVGSQLELSIEEDALHMIAKRAEGGLRDAESLLDQIYSFQGKEISVEAVASILGIMPKDSLFLLDQAGHEGKLSVAFEIVHKIFSEGKDLLHFLEMLTEHIRNILLIKTCNGDVTYLHLTESDKNNYFKNIHYYSTEQCIQLLDYLNEMLNKFKFSPSPRIALETILLTVIRSHKKIPIDHLVRRLVELEQAISQKNSFVEMSHQIPKAAPIPSHAITQPSLISQPPSISQEVISPPNNSLNKISPEKLSITIDPTPKSSDIPKKITSTVKPNMGESKKEEIKKIEEIEEKDLKSQSHYDTLLQFAAVELEGKVEKIQIKKV